MCISTYIYVPGAHHKNLLYVLLMSPFWRMTQVESYIMYCDGVPAPEDADNALKYKVWYVIAATVYSIYVVGRLWLKLNSFGSMVCMYLLHA